MDPFGFSFRMFEHYFYHSNIGLDVRQNEKDRKPEHRTRMHKNKKREWNKDELLSLTNGAHENRSRELLSTWKENITDRLNKNLMALFTNHCHFVAHNMVDRIFFYKRANLLYVFGLQLNEKFNTKWLNRTRLIVIIIL